MALTSDWCRVCLAWGTLIRAERDGLCAGCLEDRDENGPLTDERRDAGSEMRYEQIYRPR
jgi:hypothetical protein